MSLLSVYVEGAKDSSALGVRRLAALIAARYGLSAADLEKRIASGRFRVKANVDAATARAFVDDLEKLGARCLVMEVEDSSAAAPRGLRAMPALEAPSPLPGLPADRVPVSSRSVPAMVSGEVGGEGEAGVEPSPPARTTTPPARTISVSAVPPVAARTATPGLGAMGSAGEGARPRASTSGEHAPLDPPPRAATPASGIPPVARTISSVAVSRGATPPTSQPAMPAPRVATPPAAQVAVHDSRGATPPASRPPLQASRGATPPTSQPAVRTISSASIPPPTGAAALLANAAAQRAEDPHGELTPPTLRGLASSERARTPASSQPALPAASRTATLPLTGLPPRSASSSTSAPTGLTSALADATYSANPSGGLGALDGASFSLSTLDGQEDAPAVPMYEDPPLRRGTSSRPAHDEPMASLAAMEALTPVETAPPVYAAPASSAPLPPVAPARPDDIPSVPPHLGVQAPFSNPAAPTPRPSRPPRVTGVTGTSSADPFTPPMSEPSAQLQLADDRPRRTSLGSSSSSGAPEGAPMMAPAIAPASRPGGSGASVAAATHRRTRRRTALAIGVLVSVFLSFVPAHLLAQSRERAAFERIDNRVRIAQSEISSLSEWQALDDIRTALLRQKRAAHHEIIIASMALWVALAGALAFAWARFGVRRFDPVDPDDAR